MKLNLDTCDFLLHLRTWDNLADEWNKQKQKNTHFADLVKKKSDVFQGSTIIYQYKASGLTDLFTGHTILRIMAHLQM